MERRHSIEVNQTEAYDLVYQLDALLRISSEGNWAKYEAKFGYGARPNIVRNLKGLLEEIASDAFSGI